MKIAHIDAVMNFNKFGHRAHFLAFQLAYLKIIEKSMAEIRDRSHVMNE
jgi:hypothetical protein